MRLFRSLLLGLVFALFVAGGVSAQTADPVAPDPAAAAETARIEALIGTLENEAEREKFVEQLKTLLAAREKTGAPAAEGRGAGERALGFMAQRLGELGQKLFGAARAFTDLPRLWRGVVSEAGDPAARAHWFEIAWKLLAAIGAGLIAEWIIRRLLLGPRARLEARVVETWLVRLAALLARAALGMTPIVVFLGVAYAVMSLVVAGETAGAVTLILIAANVAARIVLVAARLVLAPGAPALRPVPLRDVDAAYLFIWVRRLIEAPIYASFVIEALRRLGIDEDAANGLLHVLGLLVALMAVAFVLQNRALVAGWLRGAGDGPAALGDLRARIADIWHVLAVLYVVAVFSVWSLDIEGGFEFVLRATVLTLVVLVAARLLMAGFHRLARRAFALKPEMIRRFPGLEARANRYLPLLDRAAGVVILAAAALAVLEVWGVDSFAWIESPFGRRLTGGVITVGLIVVVAVMLWEMIDAAITRYLGRAGEPGAAVGARARTLLPLLRTTTLIVLIAVVVLVTLSELGVNIAPLLAGAGVIGLAIGFGSQALVKDIITGMFILIEDQIAVGDVVKIGDHAGVVETLTLRTLRLRDLGGVVHIIPFGEVTTVENMTKEFSRYIFNVGVAYREDTDQVVAVLHEIGAGMLEEENWRADIVEPLEVLGVDSFGDNAVVIKARITTKPIRQWAVGREFNRRMKKRFDELGIEMPFPHRTLYFGEDKDGYAPPARLARATKPTAASGAGAPSAPQAAAPPPRNLPTPESGGADAPDGE
ncbi:MAG: mechanosensitive ion channel domain-containing protein [Alphaproteobacteria bacterium]